jgi:hypothetical protein
MLVLAVLRSILPLIDSPSASLCAGTLIPIARSPPGHLEPCDSASPNFFRPERERIMKKAHWIWLTLIVMAMPTAASAQGPGGPAGVDIKIRALNRSTSDTPFCGVGGGMVGDQLKVDAFMDQDGIVTGTAVFEDALGAVTVIELDRLFGFFGGVLVQNQASQNTVPIWMWDQLVSEGLTAALVNVELPRGCGNTVSTFTPGVDKVTAQIKFR